MSDMSKYDLKLISEEKVNFRDLGACGEGFDTVVIYECPCGKGYIKQINYLDRISDTRTEILCAECKKNYEIADLNFFDWNLRKTN